MVEVTVEGFEAFIAQVEAIPRNKKRAMETIMPSTLNHLRERSVVNAPILANVLRPNIKTELVSVTEEEAVGRIESSAKKGPVDYAVLMHELQVFRGGKALQGKVLPPQISWKSTGGSDRSGGRVLEQGPRSYGLGPETRKQPMTKEGGAGGKYIERVMITYYKVYLEFLLTALEDFIATGKWTRTSVRA